MARWTSASATPSGGCSPADLVFIPRNMLHGPILAAGERLAALSVFAPHFDPARPDNFAWERDTADATKPA